MYKIFSKIQKELLLHTISRFEEITEERQDISPASEFLQLSTFKMKKGKTFRAHKHIYCEKIVNIPQESWCVLKGSIIVKLYDIDDSIIEELVLREGDITITYRGGHNYECLEDETCIAEYKVPNYTGQADDKVFI
jgi:hypothetical protein